MVLLGLFWVDFACFSLRLPRFPLDTWVDVRRNENFQLSLNLNGPLSVVPFCTEASFYLPFSRLAVLFESSQGGLAGGS